MSTNRIEKEIVINASQSRVWDAIADAKKFGEWFRVNLEGQFAEGEMISGFITWPGFEHLRSHMQIVTIRPEDYFSYRWHPYAIEPEVDYSSEPMTLVEFTLHPAGKGTLLKIVETGFDALPLERRAEAFKMNDGGWAQQIENIREYLAGVLVE